MKKLLYLIRGIPGSGKTTFAESISDYVASADQYFEDEEGNYQFEASLLSQAHGWCHRKVTRWLVNGIDRVAVANTFTQKWEMEQYFKLAEMYGYEVHSIIVENRHGGENVHGVPHNKVEEMRERFEVKL